MNVINNLKAYWKLLFNNSMTMHHEINIQLSQFAVLIENVQEHAKTHADTARFNVHINHG